MRKLNINIGNLLMLTSVIVMSVYTYTVRRRNNELVKLYNKKNRNDFPFPMNRTTNEILLVKLLNKPSINQTTIINT